MKAKRKSDTLGNASAKRLLSKNRDHSWHYSGTRSELIAAELARDGDFPGDPGGPIYSRVIKRDDRRAYISIHSRVANPITFWLVVDKTPISVAKAEATRKRDEQNAERRQWRAQRRDTSRKAAEEVGSRVAAQLAKLPSSPAEYRERVVYIMRAAASHLRGALVGRGHVFGEVSDKHITYGYRVDSESLGAFDEAVNDAIEALRSARVIADARSRDAFVLNIRDE
jgi:hypothetical protein